MYVPPIIEHGLKLALRRYASGRSRFTTAAVAVGVVVLFMLFGPYFSPGSWGSTLHQWFFYGGLFLAIFPAAQIGVGLFSEERRSQMMGLLYLTGIGPGELFFGKLFGGLLVASGDLLALVPLLAVPFLGGGISLNLYVATIACLPVVLVFTVGVGVLASVLCKDEGAALACALLIAGILCLAVPLPYNLGQALAGRPPFSSWWLCLSPAYGPFLIMGGYFFGAPERFWLSALITLVWSGLCVVLAGLALRHNWRREIQGEQIAGWRRTLQSWIKGNEAWRVPLRNRLLPEKPYQWLAQQDRAPVILAWAILAGASVLWLLAWWAWPRIWPSPVMFFSTAVLLIISLQMVMAYAAARRIGTDRGDGILELLLTTPLTPKEIVEGQIAAVTAQFRAVSFTLVGLCLLMMFGGFFTRKWNEPAIIEYVLIWVVLVYWCFLDPHRIAPPAMWIAANSARPMFAVFRLRGEVWRFFYLCWYGRTFSRIFSGQTFTFPTGSDFELAMVGMGSVIAIIVMAVLRETPHGLELRLISDMRSIAQEPVPAANDPRFKKWDGKQRLPSAV
jgi:ABC-type transport system involved in multi-copper enzyme maturation permease subunit